MKKTFFFLFLLVILGCKSDYEKALQLIKEKNYEDATLYLNTIDSGEENYANARLQLKEIEKTIDSVAFVNAVQAFKEKDYVEAQLLFTGFGTSSVNYNKAQKYLVMIKPNLPKETLPNVNLIKEDDKSTQENDDEFKLAKENVIRIYKELLKFKDNPDFYEYGFAVSYKYNYWMKEIEEIRKDEEMVNRLYDEGYPVIDLQQMGFEYRSSGGKETKFTRFMKNKYSGIRKVSH